MTASAIWLSVPPSPDTSEIGEGERVRCTAACMAPGRGAFAVRGLRRFLPGRGGLANSQCYERRREKLRGGAVCCSQHAFPTLVCVAGPRPATGRGGLSGPLQALEFGLVHARSAAAPACVAGVMHGHVYTAVAGVGGWGCKYMQTNCPKFTVLGILSVHIDHSGGFRSHMRILTVYLLF